MNRLQGIETDAAGCSSRLNPRRANRPGERHAALLRLRITRCLRCVQATRGAEATSGDLQGQGGIWYCGSLFRRGLPRGRACNPAWPWPSSSAACWRPWDGGQRVRIASIWRPTGHCALAEATRNDRPSPVLPLFRHGDASAPGSRSAAIACDYRVFALLCRPRRIAGRSSDRLRLVLA